MNQSKPEQMEPRFANGAMEGYAYDAHKFLDELLAFPGVQAVAVAAGGRRRATAQKRRETPQPQVVPQEVKVEARQR